MAAGVPAIYQAVLQHGEWRGYADFLERVERPSQLGDWSYEVADTKLARRAKPYFVIQLCSIRADRGDPGRRAGEMHVVLGNGERETFSGRDFAAYFRALQARLDALLARTRARSYPLPSSTAPSAAGPTSATRAASPTTT